MKMWALSVRKWLSSIWRKLRYAKTFLLQSSLRGPPATMPKLQKAKAGIKKEEDQVLL